MTDKANRAVRAIDVTRTFKVGDAEVAALRGVTLDVVPGEFLALVGPSGSGKSTFLNLVGGLDRPTGGELWVNGVELGASKEKALTEHRRRRVGFVFQSFNLLPRLTALENVALPLMFVGVPERERLARAGELLAQVGLAGRTDHRPTQLSGGEQQRVAIARAIVGRPAILLADEPTGNLDSVTGREILHLLCELNEAQGVTVLLVTHDPEAADYAGRVVRMRDGRIEKGVHAGRKSDEGRFVESGLAGQQEIPPVSPAWPPPERGPGGSPRSGEGRP